MGRKTERIGYLREKDHKWILTFDEGENTFTSKFSAIYFAKRNKIKVIN